MKYGKEFQHILDASDFPDDWKTSAIEYRKLKKLIKNVQAELEGMGLSPAVLRQLLVTDASSGPGAPGPSRSSTAASDPTSEPEFEPEFFEFEFDPAGPSSPKEVLLDPVFDGDDEETPVTPRFRVRMLSESEGTSLGTSPAPISVADLMLRSERGRASSPISMSPARVGSPSNLGRVVKADGVTAQYVLAGDESNPVPQIRLSVLAESLPMTRSTTALSSSPRDGDSDTDLTDQTDAESDILEIPHEPELPASPALLKMRTAMSPIWTLASAGQAAQGMAELNLGEAAAPRRRADVELDLDATPTMRPFSGAAPVSVDIGNAAIDPIDDLSHGTSPEPREFIIPLQSDMAFFSVLTAALTSLSRFHAAQQAQFHADVEALCRSIGESITPGDGVTVLPTPLNSGGPGTVTKYEYKSTTPSQKDLYAWRDIFALWVESEIFESSSERDRGERSVDEAERRLHAFAAEVVRRGLGDRRTIRGKKTRKAWDDFLKLNVRLLDLKRFQLANINAARKILKKHDKRTALTASTGLASFVRSTLATHVDKHGNVNMWTFYNTSLPHVLLASMTETLLPILPSLDDFACLICMSIAFKPIRLTCGHLFCVRCLVKMQQRGNDSCPLCRSNTVLLADRGCLDVTLMNFMKDWFPREVRAKQLEATAEIARESLEDAAGVRPTERDRGCVIM
ncbi:hypothetical protein CC85DRAFT_105615 [Cutaneotrichosporon oleaginosum]|uniref:SPX-domain-containing protein n=1 Tax=Cutaneotrichosporon oleaginosum TaxID=879819 RepID=A0A0J0XL93_9TREE|nr:uncharacterized protein CC85DRAFT_105615 [Cutaneotrichosporon oleaginosum]KLT41865.1 hypothetical protein CC85DRAFT_105615 [Cutaneotrichosporon oleaginosum]TXT14783.1 hypothetical protein COLE_00976 [Cutaneotrichosporon oleaginosum]